MLILTNISLFYINKILFSYNNNNNNNNNINNNNNNDQRLVVAIVFRSQEVVEKLAL